MPREGRAMGGPRPEMIARGARAAACNGTGHGRGTSAGPHVPPERAPGLAGAGLGGGGGALPTRGRATPPEGAPLRHRQSLISAHARHMRSTSSGFVENRAGPLGSHSQKQKKGKRGKETDASLDSGAPGSLKAPVKQLLLSVSPPVLYCP